MLGFFFKCIEIDITISTSKILISVLNLNNMLSAIANVQHEVSYFRNLSNQIQRDDSYLKINAFPLYGITECSSYNHDTSSVQLNLNLPTACKHLCFLAAVFKATQNSTRLRGCAVSRSLWPVSSRATANPLLCCSSLVACKDSVSAMLKRAFQSISWD